MAVAVPRQFEIARAAARGQFPTKIRLATSIETYTKQHIRENRASAFQRLQNDEKRALQARTIVSYITVSEHIGTLSDSLQPTGPVTSETRLRGFVNHLKDCLLPYAKRNRFSLEEIRDFISATLNRSRPIEPMTPQLFYAKLNPNIPEFTFTQCLLMFDELFPEMFRMRSVRLLLHRDALWGNA